MLLNPRKESEPLDLAASVEQDPFLFSSKLVLLLFAIEISNDSISAGAPDLMLGILAEGLGNNNPYDLYGLVSAFPPS